MGGIKSGFPYGPYGGTDTVWEELRVAYPMDDPCRVKVFGYGYRYGYGIGMGGVKSGLPCG